MLPFPNAGTWERLRTGRQHASAPLRLCDKADGKISIITGIGGGDCGYNFKEDKSYIVYAQKQPYILIDSFNDENKTSFKSHDEILFETNVCTGTTDQVTKEEALLKRQFNKK